MEGSFKNTQIGDNVHVLSSIGGRIFHRTLLGMLLSLQDIDTLLVFRPKQDTRNINCV